MMRTLYQQMEIISKEIEIMDAQMVLAELKGNIENKKELGCELKLKKAEKGRQRELIKDRKPNNDFQNKLINSDCLDVLCTIENDSIDMFLSDIPYGINLDQWDVLHNNTNSALLGASPAQQGKSGFKRRGKPINGWNEDDRNNNKYYEEWCLSWSLMLYDIMKEGAPVLIFGGRRTLHGPLKALERAGFLVKDVLAWKKDCAHHRSQDIFKVLVRRGSYRLTGERINQLALTINDLTLPASLDKLNNKKFGNIKEFIKALDETDPLLTKKFLYEILDVAVDNNEVRQQIDTWRGWKLGNLAPIYEPIAWLFKPYSSVTLTDNLLENKVGAMNFNECRINGKSPTNLIEYGYSEEETKNRLHDAQKPLELIKYLIKLFTLPGQTVLDCFVGSGTTALAAKQLDRNFIAVEKNNENYKIALNRLEG